MTTASGLRVGFVGTGWTQRVQIPAFRLGGLEIQAVCSRDPANARQAAAQHAIPDVHDRWEELVQSDRVDIVSVATPPALHLEITVAALQAGKHVICEKPTALNAAQANAMLAAAQAAPGQLAIVDHELRFTPQRREMRRLIQDGYVGRVLWTELSAHDSRRLSAESPWRWMDDVEQGGGVLNAMGSHLFDLCRWSIGRIDSLTSQLKTAHHYRPQPASGILRAVSADDYAHLVLHYVNGAQGTITASSLTPHGRGLSALVVGTDGALRLDHADRLWGSRNPEYPTGVWSPIEVADPVAQMEGLPNSGPFARGSVYLAQAVAAALSSGEHWLPDGANFLDGLAVQRALDLARRSHQEQIWITL